LIRGYDPLIASKAPVANPDLYGSQRIELFGGATIGGKFVGLDDVSVAIEGGRRIGRLAWRCASRYSDHAASARRSRRERT
jgi:hypothetical protein